MPSATLTPLSAFAARDLLQAGAWLVDIRDLDEHIRVRVDGAISLPLSEINASALIASAHTPGVIFHCRSGTRTASQSSALASCAPCNAYVLEGGMEAWAKAGLPLLVDKRQPLPIMRQVQIAAGSLVLIGVLLGAVASPWFHALSGVVGAGLIFAGVSGFCGMARVLSRMPWNR